MNAAGVPTYSDDLSALPALPPRPSTAQHAASVLRTQITTGRLMPGTRLREEHVAESFAISRNTVREVFRLLAHERLVEHVPYRGVHIRRIGADDIKGIYRTRRLVEPLGLQAALTDPELRQELAEIVDHANRAAEQQDWQQVGTSDIAFHRVLVDACHSIHLTEMFEQLLAELRLAFLQLPDPEELHRPYLKRNKRLLELLQGGHQAEVFDELADYLASAEHDVLQELHT